MKKKITLLSGAARAVVSRYLFVFTLTLIALLIIIETSGQVKLLADIAASDETIYNPYTDFRSGNGRLYFLQNKRQLWTSIASVDNQDENKMLKEFAAISNLIMVGNTLYFVADDEVRGPELWKSNGTAAGTILV